ncbi:hypothetical protein NDU88_005818 [Pleurodeles waltl]|uniref:Uncharacterized protein n=1 Tax=Pleurodeles waltl TaxID=8319 RepID=A0AAV7MZ41_PLEWA|nr:hypothetical protein NDU88_005818 [Pleurodeles waltl]
MFTVRLTQWSPTVHQVLRCGLAPISAPDGGASESRPLLSISPVRSLLWPRSVTSALPVVRALPVLCLRPKLPVPRVSGRAAEDSPLTLYSGWVKDAGERPRILELPTFAAYSMRALAKPPGLSIHG